MEEEMASLIRACAVVPAALGYCYVLPFWTSAGRWRLIAVLPVAVLFAALPFSFRSIHLRGISAFFLCWLGTFKIFLFSLGRGPLSPADPVPPSSFPAFVAVAALPIKVRRKQPQPQRVPVPRPLVVTLLGFAAKGLLLAAIIVSVYPHRRRLRPDLLLAFYCVHMYLSLDMVLAAAAAAGRALLPAGTELAPQFAAPYLSSSLQEFWGRRWNLMVSDILRSAVYVPIRSAWGTAAGVMAAFLVSALMHEVMFYYLTLEPPTGEVSCFFALQGACTALEIAAKRWWARRGPLRPAVAAPLTVGFVVATGMWLFFPQIRRSGAEEAVMSEAEALVGMLWGGARGRRAR